MRKLLLKISCAMIMFSLGVGLHTIRPTTQRSRVGVTQVDNTPVVEAVPATPIGETTETEPIQLSGIFTSEEALRYDGYLIEKRNKTVKFEDLNGYQSNQSYVVISKGVRPFRSFDAAAYHPAGNVVDFGLFPFLGTQSKQVAISQDVARGGAQWIVDLSSKPRVIFDGVAWGVGRESDNCVVEDLDGDGAFEISLPVTDFYALMDKMSVSGVPLPMITFKYDSGKRRYLPVNHVLKVQPPSLDTPDEANELYFRSVVLSNMLELIYQGKRDDAWQYFNAAYNLSDKKEIERRVKDILRDQPVYKFIYKQRRNE